MKTLIQAGFNGRVSTASEKRFLILRVELLTRIIDPVRLGSVPVGEQSLGKGPRPAADPGLANANLVEWRRAIRENQPNYPNLADGIGADGGAAYRFDLVCEALLPVED